MSPSHSKRQWTAPWKNPSKFRPVKFEELILKNLHAGRDDTYREGGRAFILAHKLHLITTEENPLLGDQIQPDSDSAQCALPNEDVYNRFSREQKRVILAIVALTGLVPMFVTGCFVPSIPHISKDLDSSPAAVSLGISLAVLASSIGVMFWSAYSSFYGRRTIYLCQVPFTILGSFAVAASTDLTSLLFWRFVQMFGCSGSYALGAATIGDVYKVEERGTAMGTFLGVRPSAIMLCTLAEYWSWRGFQAALGMWGVIQMLLLAFFYPETAHPGSRGIDKERDPKKLFVWINPFRCLAFLRSPNIIAIVRALYLMVFGTRFQLCLSLTCPKGAKYGIASQALIGALFLPSGLGNFVGAPIAGRLSDMVVRRAKQERNGVWVPEDRLRVVWLGELVLIPVSVTLAGFTTTYVDGTVGLVINLMCLFTNGIGVSRFPDISGTHANIHQVDMVLTPIGTYTVDIMPSRCAEVSAAMSALRSLLVAPTTALLIPSVQTIGVAATNSVSGILAVVGYFLIWLTMRYGEQMRTYVDVGFPNFDTRAEKGDDSAGQN
ncbi:major facilitator superfamily domain-containing protein [Lanmaoa asiatica]|nr:major facilitator superfamily domain-containing protein [Lanmaoa asiatica]